MIDERLLIEEIARFKRSQKSENCDYLTGYISALSAVEGMIAEQPKVGEWIPCSERLPEDLEKVLVWFEYFRYGECNRLYQTIGISYTWNGEWSGFVNGTSGWHKLRILAWQPLPQPYREKVE